MSFGDQPDTTGHAAAAVLGLRGGDGPVDVDLFLVYTGVSIAQTFFATAAAFMGLSLYGYTTKSDLSGMRHVPDHGRGRPLWRW